MATSVLCALTAFLNLEDGFEIRTARHLYVLKPKEASAENWVEAITEVMFDTPEEELAF